METVKIKTEAKYVSHDVKQNKSINVNFKMPYSELTNYIQSIQMLNENITLAGKIGSDKKPLKFGMFSLNNINIDRDGEGKIRFNSQLDFVESQNINELANRNDEPLILFLKAEIDVEIENNEENAE
jgi:hypothetical protein